MIWPLDETLMLLEPHLPQALISPQTFSSIKTIATWLPDAMSSYYLECRLGATANQVDFLTCATVSEGGREILAGHNEQIDLPTILLENALWRRVRDFFLQWAEPTSPLYWQVPQIWLEFEAAEQPLKIPLPSLLFCLSADHCGYLKGHTKSQNFRSLNRQHYQQITDIACACLLDPPISLPTKQNLLYCFDRLPGGGYLIHLSAMLPRQPSVLKANLSILRAHLLEYIRAIGWNGSSTRLEAELAKYCPSTARTKFQVTVGDRISSKLEFEFHFDALSQSSSLEYLLAQLVTAGLCTAEKQEALLAWPGGFRTKFSQQAWPTRIAKWLDVKLTFQGCEALEAKGYLGFAPTLSL